MLLIKMKQTIKKPTAYCKYKKITTNLPHEARACLQYSNSVCDAYISKDKRDTVRKQRRNKTKAQHQWRVHTANHFNIKPQNMWVLSIILWHSIVHHHETKGTVGSQSAVEKEVCYNLTSQSLVLFYIRLVRSTPIRVFGEFYWNRARDLLKGIF